MKLRKLLSLALALLLAVMCTACSDTPNATTVSPDELTAPDKVIDLTDGEENSAGSEDEKMEATYKKYTAAKENVKVLGRTYLDDDKVQWIVSSASGIEFLANGTDLRITLISDNRGTFDSNNPTRYAIYVNGERVLDQLMRDFEYTVCIQLPEGENTVRFVKLSEVGDGIIGIKDISICSAEDIKPTPESSLKIEFIGDSITCGYGVDDEDRDHHYSTATEDATKTYAYKTAQALGADHSFASFSGYGIVSSYTGDGTKNESGLVPRVYTKLGRMWDSSFRIPVNELDWNFKQFVPDIVVINLGTNDSSYVQNNAEKAKEFEAGYVEFLKLVRKNNPDAHIVCALGMMGDSLYPSVENAAKTYSAETGDENISWLRFGPIKGDEGHAADWHPTEATQTRCAGELIEHLITVSEEAKALYAANN